MTTRAAYLRAHEVASLLGLSERSIRRWIAAGNLPSVRIGGARLVATADLERLLSPDIKIIDERLRAAEEHRDLSRPTVAIGKA